MPIRITVATYNIHRSIGTDGRCDPGRVAEVIRSLDADVVGLQEVASGFRSHNGLDQLGWLSRETGYQAVAGATLENHEGFYGNAILTRLPVAEVRKHDISVPGREPRGALDADLLAAECRMRFIVTHFGLRAIDRAIQCSKIASRFEGDGVCPLVVLGDLNGWDLRSRSLSGLCRHFGPHPTFRTYPSWFPLLCLDRILVRPEGSVVELGPHITAVSRKASDHLPLRAVIEI